MIVEGPYSLQYCHKLQLGQHSDLCGTRFYQWQQHYKLIIATPFFPLPNIGTGWTLSLAQIPVSDPASL